jgi:pimeloyl-ACP methyl ester carboxylesterase
MDQFHFTKSGEGATVVLVHGWGGNLGSLEELREKLTGFGYLVYNLELKGFGETGEPEEPWGVNDYSNYIIKFCTSQKISKPILVGHSFSGKIVLDIAANKMFELGKIVLIGADGIYPNFSLRNTVFRFLSAVKRLLPEALQDALARKYYKYILKKVDFIKTSDVMRKTLIKCEKIYYDNRLDQIKIPTLIIWGARDKITPLWMGELIHKGIAGSRFEVIEDIGHAIPLKNPGYIAELIKSF